MAGYIGVTPVPKSTQNRQVFTATAGQTSFATAGYTPGYVDVYLNGVKLIVNEDYTSINGSDIVLASGAELNDSLEVISFSTFDVADQSVVAIWSDSVVYAEDQPVFFEGEPYKINPNNPPAAGESPAMSPDKWIATGGGGSGTVNFLLNPLTSASVSNWSRSAGTLVWNTTQNLVSVGSLQAETFATGQTIDGDFIPTINAVDGGQAWEIKLGYYIDAGATYTDGQIQVVLLDGANEISGGNLPIVLGTVSQTSVFVWPSTTLTGLKVRIKCSGGTGNLRIADVAVRPQQIMSVPAVSGWMPYTPSFPAIVSGAINTSVGTLSAIKASYRRVGNLIQIRCWVSHSPGTGSGIIGIDLPPGLTIDSSNAPPSGSGGATVGSATWYNGTLVRPGSAFINDVVISMFKPDALSPVHWTEIVEAGIDVTIPIAQWSANIQVSGEETIYLSNSESTINTNGVVDKTYYGIEGSPILANTVNAIWYKMGLPRKLLPNETLALEFRDAKNGHWVPQQHAGRNYSGYPVTTIPASRLTDSVSITGAILENSGTTIGSGEIILHLGQYASSVSGIGNQGWGEFTTYYDRWRVRISRGGSMAEVPPVVYAHYSGGFVSGTPANLATKIEDTHGAVTTGASWKFTCPVTGLYSVSVAIKRTNQTGVTWLRKNTTNTLALMSDNSGSSWGLDYVRSEGKVRLSMGDTLDVTTGTGMTINDIQITRIGS